ncbi:putative nuclease HARBI1 [Schistocerca piceifrons]|uniref:putative nuclease HARBI1 n=1 Tax=Schistocerca piceifrons TaxID=274613 RepID=UPI001F5E8A80|nr:putative nuclease HARBI1 [Schistocerca piceifrons]
MFIRFVIIPTKMSLTISLHALLRCRLAVTLRFLATGESFKSLAFSHRIAQPTISNVIVDVCTANCETLKDQYLKAPSTEEWNKIAKEFDELWQFPNCIGAMDGKHTAFAPPRTAGSTYFNYKKFHSVVLLAIVDARYRFSLIDIGCNGRVSDGGVYANSLISSALRENWLKVPQQKSLPGTNIEVPYVILADDAFHLEPYIMKPYRDCQNQNSKQIFNYRLSRGRRVVENSFGILANRFRVLLSTMRLPVEKVELIVQTLCILHNYLIEEADTTYVTAADTENTDLCTINNGSWRGEKSLSSIPQQSGNRTSLCAREVREKFCEFFSTTGYVSWQWEAVKKYNF